MDYYAPPMRLILVLLVLFASVTVALAQSSSASRVQSRVIEIPDMGQMGYTISVPRDADTNESRPLVLALHPGGGSRGGPFLTQIVEPALREWNAIIVAPDSPTRSWTTAVAKRAVLHLLDDLLKSYTIDQQRILVTGFSMGGFGSWFLATHHPERFTGVIPMASSPRDYPLDGLGSMPVHAIHSREDTVVPIGPAREAVATLEQANHPVRFTELGGVGHFQMTGYIDALRTAGKWMMEQWDR